MEPLVVVKIVISLVMSAIIGIFTNYIAVKMLFRPYRAKYIGKFHIPFTPGIMPRRQGALAKALGRMISESLVRTEDLKNALLSDEISHTIARGILSFPSVRVSGALPSAFPSTDIERGKVFGLNTLRRRKIPTETACRPTFQLPRADVLPSQTSKGKGRMTESGNS